MSTPEEETPKNKRFVMTPAPPDDPIYTRGFMVGMRRLPKAGKKDEGARDTGKENKEG